MITVVVYHSNFNTLPGAWVRCRCSSCSAASSSPPCWPAEGRRHGRVSLQTGSTRGGRSACCRRWCSPWPSWASTPRSSTWPTPPSASGGTARPPSSTTPTTARRSGHAPFFGFLAQTWSLSVEEQFYVIWSVLMVAAVASHRRRLAYGFAIAGIGLAASPTGSTWPTRPPLRRRACSPASTTPSTAGPTPCSSGCLLGLLATDGYLSGWRPWADAAADRGRGRCRPPS